MTRTYPPRPIVGVGVCLIRDTDVLLIRRANPPLQGAWSLPGGIQRLGETLHAAARRELWEETATTAGPLHLAAAIDSIHPDPTGAIQYHYTIIDFAARWLTGHPTPATDATEAAWINLANLPDLALSAEIQHVITRARARLSD